MLKLHIIYKNNKSKHSSGFPLVFPMLELILHVAFIHIYFLCKHLEDTEHVMVIPGKLLQKHLLHVYYLGSLINEQIRWHTQLKKSPFTIGIQVVFLQMESSMNKLHAGACLYYLRVMPVLFLFVVTFSSVSCVQSIYFYLKNSLAVVSILESCMLHV